MFTLYPFGDNITDAPQMGSSQCIRYDIVIPCLVWANGYHDMTSGQQWSLHIYIWQCICTYKRGEKTPTWQQIFTQMIKRPTCRTRQFETMFMTETALILIQISQEFVPKVRVSLKHIRVTDPTDLTHWGRMTHICMCKLSIIGSDNGLSPGRRQAIIRTNAGILVIGSLWATLNESLIEMCKFSFKKIHFKMSFCRPQCVKWYWFNVISGNIFQK